MKYILLLILLLISPHLLAQVGVIDIDSLDVLLPLLLNYSNDARKCGQFDIPAIISKNLGGIKVITPQQMDKLKRTDSKITPLAITKYKIERDILNFTYSTPTIYILEETINNPNLIKWIVYHELGHIIGMEHISNQIMQPTVYTKTKELTEGEIKQYFNSFRKDKHWKKSDNTYH